MAQIKKEQLKRIINKEFAYVIKEAKKNDAYFDYAVVVEPHSVSQGLIHVFTYAFNF